MDVTQLSIMQMRNLLIQKKISCEELIIAHLKKIDETNHELNSFITVCHNYAKEQAKKADSIIQSQCENSPILTGIPVAIKDMLVTKEIKTTCGSKILGEYISPFDCTAVRKLKEQGAIIVGKTNLDEFAMGSSNENSAFGPVKNAHNRNKVSGGSSGGSAVAVAAFQSPIALGTDTGGSIRQPASFNGIIGLKPTYGRVSRYGAVAFASSLDQIGPFARNIDDICITLKIISGYDIYDSTSMKKEVPNFLEEVRQNRSKNLKGIKIGIPKEYKIKNSDPEIWETLNQNLKILENLGAEIVEISLPHTDYAIATYYIIAPAEASSNLARYDGVRYGLRVKDQISSLEEMYEKTRSMGFGKEVKRRILIGTYVLSAGYYSAYYLKAQKVRTLIIEDFKQAFKDKCDVIVAPTAPTSAFNLGEKTKSPIDMYLEDIFTIPASLAGLPAISIPGGKDKTGMPLGLQLIGKPFCELDLLKVADLFSNC